MTRTLRVSPLTSNRDEDFAYLAEATRDKEWISGLDVRRLGDRLTKDELKSFGARGNSIITRQFVDILTEEGRTDVIKAADTIANMINRAIDTAIYLANPDRDVLLELNNMAAGPCAAIQAVIFPSKAGKLTPLPLASCAHPDQCACRYRYVTKEPDDVNLTPEDQEFSDTIADALLGSIVIRIGPEPEPNSQAIRRLVDKGLDER